MSLRDHQKENSVQPKKYLPVSYIIGMGLVAFLLIRLMAQIHSPFTIPQIIKTQGAASWYKPSGKLGGMKPICASRDYPKGSFLIITNLTNHKQVVCRVAEHGPSPQFNRIVDLSEDAFKEIASDEDGIIQVSVRKLT